MAKNQPKNNNGNGSGALFARGVTFASIARYMCCCGGGAAVTVQERDELSELVVDLAATAGRTPEGALLVMSAIKKRARKLKQSPPAETPPAHVVAAQIRGVTAQYLRTSTTAA